MVGIDIVDVSRITDILRRYGDRFLYKIFTEEEIAYARQRRSADESLAGRFAAKEAFMKATGKKLAWKDINVLQREGKPYIEFQGKIFDGVSISHEKAYAVSIVVI
ncbi:MAG TPA: holo-ACP synthase [Syntrophorhabdaceae bacterium]|jgi:holo-[acyl-carrier-protein] synthase|nr:holo-ACP synthase [Syntrophorhabdaceae bacterium]HOF56987.1 holo-ACP synthase [Syntrophorhabdaceae bacterium]HOS04498.1 holo-ACP synthase [Syntrophorhabdaceae bacterium]HPL40153.1 holo-ACP synthase [Syntrophorhabdaceae bacterium]HQP51813.1 holo-ACP synthase [Syntrophorhabdaceae bacterium]